MTPLFAPLPTFKGVSSNANAEVQATTMIPPGLLLRRIVVWAMVAAGNKVLTDILGDTRLLIDGDVKRIATADQVNQINALNGERYGLSEAGSIGGANLQQALTFHLFEPWRTDPLSSNGRAYSWNLDPKQVPGVEIQLNIKTGLTSPLLWGFYEYEPMVAGNGIGDITRWERRDAGPQVTPFDYSDAFDIRNPGALHSAHIFPTVGGQYVTKASLKFGSVLFLDQVDYLTQQSNLINYGLVPDGSATPRYDIVLDRSDSFRDALPLGGQVSQNLKLDFSSTPSGNQQIITQVSRPGV